MSDETNVPPDRPDAATIRHNARLLFKDSIELARMPAALASAGGEELNTLRELLACFRAWEPEARVLGDVRAGDAARAIEAVLDARPAPDEGECLYPMLGPGACSCAKCNARNP